MNICATASVTLLSQRFADVIGLLCAKVAARGGRDHAVGPLVMVVWGYLSRLRQRFDRLLVRMAAGERQAPARVRTGRALAGDKDRADVMLPRGRGWLILFAQECAQMGELVRMVADDPAMAEVLAAFPSARRIFRPLCRALAVPCPVGLLNAGEQPEVWRQRKAPVSTAPVWVAAVVHSPPVTVDTHAFLPGGYLKRRNVF